MGDRVKYALSGLSKIILPTFFSTRLSRTVRQSAAHGDPKHVFPCKEVPFGGLVDTSQSGWILGAYKQTQFWGPR